MMLKITSRPKKGGDADAGVQPEGLSIAEGRGAASPEALVQARCIESAS